MNRERNFYFCDLKGFLMRHYTLRLVEQMNLGDGIKLHGFGSTRERQVYNQTRPHL